MIKRIECYRIICDNCEQEMTIDGDSMLRCDTMEEVLNNIKDSGWTIRYIKNRCTVWVLCESCKLSYIDEEKI